MAKPSVPETVVALDELVAANKKLRQFIVFLDKHAKADDKIYRALNTDLRNQVARLMIDVESVMKKTELMVEEYAHA
ncbi:MAG TPA: hypothetical protein VKX17_09945 [Planctomycetota bacterium]|nr:hypothetical protein [Planctomycetota bacterium]